MDVFSKTDNIKKELKYKPKVDVEEGVKNFVKWFNYYYKLK